MGFVLLDLTFRVERAFKIKMPKDWPLQLGLSSEEPKSDATLLQYHRFVLQLCGQQNVAPPADSWAVLTRIVGNASGLYAEEITTETKMIEHIGPCG